MALTEQDQELIEKAKSLVQGKKVTGGIIKEVGAALLTAKGDIFTGVSLDLYCGVGFCAEHAAIASMATNSDETQIQTIVAYGKTIMYPCGRCREIMQLMDKWNLENTDVIISQDKKIKLKELLPGSWLQENPRDA